MIVALAWLASPRSWTFTRKTIKSSGWTANSFTNFCVLPIRTFPSAKMTRLSFGKTLLGRTICTKNFANLFLKFLESDGGKATLKQNLIGNLAIEVIETEIDAVLDTVLPAWIEAGRKGGNAEACANIF